jgi:hypothetical protein
MAILLIYGSKTQKATERLLAQWREEGIKPIILEIDQRVPRHLTPPGTSFRTYESYLREEDLEEIDEAAAKFAQCWYKIDAKDITLLSGISGGVLQELNVFYKAVLLFKNLECAYKILSRENIGYLYVGEGVSLVRWAWLAMAAVHGVKATLLPLDTPSLSPLLDVKRSIFTTIVRELRRLASVIVGLLSGFKLAKQHLQTHKITLAICEGRSTCAIWFDQLRAASDFHLLPLRSTETLLTWFQRWMGVLWFRILWYRYQLRLQHQSIFNYRGVNIWPYWKTEFRRLFFERFPPAYHYIQCLLFWIHQNHVQGIIIPWHKLSRLIYEVAQVRGIPLIVLQDSWLPGEHFPPGYRRFMRCNHLLVWGDISASWARNLESTHIHVVGNPKAPTLDLQHYHSQRKDRFNPRKQLTVTLTHQCWGPWTAFHSPLDTNDMLYAFAEAARTLRDVQFVIKVHPLVDDPNHEWPGRSDEIRQWVLDQQLPNFTMLPLESSIQEVLQETDLLVSYYSLTAVEALAQGIPVAMMNLTDKRDLFPELVELGGAPAIRSVEDLVSLIRDIQNGVKRDTNQAQYFLEKIFGNSVDITQVVRDIVQQSNRLDRENLDNYKQEG